MKYSIPKPVLTVMKELESKGFEAFAVGGAVRDTLLKLEPKDWDVATNAKPEQIQEVFPDNLYENQFGTVTVRTGDDSVAEVEVTTYRVDGGYTDGRHPDAVTFTESLKEDLARRDFTVNAMAFNANGDIHDPFKGKADLDAKLLRAVGNPTERFDEDALRLMRAVRFAAQLGFGIEEKTLEAVSAQAELLKNVSQERIRDEFIKTIMTPHAGDGIRLFASTKLLDQFLPELTEGIGVDQNHHHVFTVFEHLVKSLEYAVKKNYSLEVRIASLFHDIGKPESKQGEGDAATFYNHEHIGAKMVKTIMKRMKFSNEVSEQVHRLVRYHQFYYDTEEVTASSVRRLVKNVGLEHMDELLQVREADRIGSGVPKAVPYKLRHLKFMIEQVSTDPISPKMLAVRGDVLMKELGVEPGPRLGLIIKALLADVLEEPKHNTKEYLMELAEQLNKKTDEELTKSLEKIEQAQKDQEEKMKRKYYVK